MARFTNLYDDKAETVAAQFSSGNLTPATAAPTVVTPTVASQLVIQTQPSAIATAGQVLSTQPVVDEEDQYGNLESGDHSAVVTVSIAGDVGLLQGTTSATLTGGVATFTKLADDKAQVIKIQASGAGLIAAVTNAITVAPQRRRNSS